MTPPNHRSGAHGSEQTFFVRKSKIEAVSRGNSTPSRGFPQNPQKCGYMYSFSKSPDRQKYIDFGLILQPTTARYTRTLTMIWVSIDFYFFSRIQQE